MLNKIFKVLLVLSIFFVGSTTYAQEESHDVTISDIDIPDIYDVDIKWGSMEFSFVEEEKYVYNSDTHIYNRNINKYWVSTSNNIEINNKSVEDVNVNFSFNSSDNNIKGSFSNNDFNLKSLASQKIELNLNGNIDSSYNEFKIIGRIFVTVS